MDRDKLITWILLGAILYEVSKIASPSAAVQYGALGNGFSGPCGTLFPENQQWPNQTPYWIQQMAVGDPNATFTYQAE